MSVVAFDSALFLARYPEFSAVDPLVLAIYFGEAGLYLRNDGCSVVTDLNARRAMLYMLTAHICELNNILIARGSQQLVGRISSASEGTVRVETSMGPSDGSAAWFQQTKFGAAYWAASAPYRSMRYVQ